MCYTFPLEVTKRCTSVMPRVDEVVVGEDGGVRVAHDQHGAAAEVLSEVAMVSFKGQNGMLRYNQYDL